MLKDTSLSSKFLTLIVHTVLLILLITTLAPVLHIMAVSLSDDHEVFKRAVTFFPRKMELDAYKLIFDSPSIPRAFKYSIIYTTLGTCINIVMTTLMAYPLSKKRLAFRGSITMMIIITMFFSGGLIPTFIVVKTLGLYNTIWALVLPGAIAAWNVIILRTFFMAMPDELEDSAFIDGANEFTVLLKIVLPLSKAAIATITLFYAVGHWNSWFPAVIYLKDIRKYPLQVILRQIVIQGEMVEELAKKGKFADAIKALHEWEKHYTCVEKIKYAVLFASMLPMLIIYPFIQKYFVRGIMIGALKG